MPSPTPAEEEAQWTLRANNQAEHYVIALHAPGSRLLWAMKQDGTLVIGEGCGPQEAVEWLSKLWDQYGSAAQVRRSAIRRCLAAVEGLSANGEPGGGDADDCLWAFEFKDSALSALTALLDGEAK